MMTRACGLCHNQEPVEDYLVPSANGHMYNHPNCAKCRAMLEGFGIPQKSPYA